MATIGSGWKYVRMAGRPKIAIVGAGFGGLAAAKKLRNMPVDVTIIDRHNYHTFQPLLYQVATAGLKSSDVGYPVRGIFQKSDNVLFKQGEVDGIDWEGKRVLLQGENPIAFDYVILAAGSKTNYFGTPGAQEFTYPLYTLPDALELRNHILSMFEAADSVHGLVEDGILNFVVIGGGPTGVEVSGAISALINKVLVKDYHDLDVERSQVILVEGGQALLTPFDTKLQDYTLKSLKKRGVEVRLGSMVSEVTKDEVIFADGSRLKTRLVIWAGGVAASEIASEIAMEQGKGDRIMVTENLRIPGLDYAFAIGDVAQVPDGKDGYLPQLAQPAIQGGRYAAKQILADIAYTKIKDFKYFDKGIMATIGRNSAVAELSNGWRLTGPIAWLAWGFLHLVYLLGAANKASVMMSWFWSYFTFDHGPRLILSAEPVPQRTEAPPNAIPPPKPKPAD